MTKVLILGSSGLLGSTIHRVLKNDFEIVGTHFTSPTNSPAKSIYLEINSPGMFEQIVQTVLPNYVINCIGATNVDDCERFPEKAMLLNAIFPYKVAKASKKFGFQLIQISTDHFSSIRNEVRDEQVNPIPLNTYGYSKISGDHMVLNENPKSLVLRTNFFGISARRNHSLLDFAISSFHNKLPVFGFKDVLFSPLGVTQIGKFLAKEIESNYSGILNLTGSESITKLYFLREVAKVLNFDPNLVVSSSSKDFPSLVDRPTTLSLDNTKLLRLGVKIPNLMDMIWEELSDRVIV